MSCCFQPDVSGPLCSEVVKERQRQQELTPSGRFIFRVGPETDRSPALSYHVHISRMIQSMIRSHSAKQCWQQNHYIHCTCMCMYQELELFLQFKPVATTNAQ